MNSPVYSFGPQAHPAIALSLRDALHEQFPQFTFDIEMMSTLSGLRETVTLCNHPNGRPATTSPSFQRMIMFSQGFVAGFGGGVEPPTRAAALRRTMTRADCPAAKRKSEPPPPSNPTLPSASAPIPLPAPLPSVRHVSRRPTITGIAPPSATNR